MTDLCSTLKPVAVKLYLMIREAWFGIQSYTSHLKQFRNLGDCQPPWDIPLLLVEKPKEEFYQGQISALSRQPPQLITQHPPTLISPRCSFPWCCHIYLLSLEGHCLLFISCTCLSVHIWHWMGGPRDGMKNPISLDMFTTSSAHILRKHWLVILLRFNM